MMRCPVLTDINEISFGFAMPGPDIDYVNLWPTRWVLGKWCPVLTDTGLVPGVLAYATAMRFPVLRCAIRYRVTANGVCQATSGTRTRPMVHDCHEMSGTDVGYAPTRNTGTQYGKASRNPGKKCDGSMQVCCLVPAWQDCVVLRQVGTETG